VQVTEDIREWDYGDYEGKTSKQIREERKEQGMGEWDIWRDGCPEGEYVVFSPLPFRTSVVGWLMWEGTTRALREHDVERKDRAKR